MNTKLLFSKQDSLYLKGIAISLILFHNFLHLLPPNYGCNEFSFEYGRTQLVLQSLNFAEAINILFSFFGYAGIYIFFFLSGYGLTKQTMLHHQKDKFYALKRISKLWKLLFIGAIWYVVVSLGEVDYVDLLRKLTMTDNLFKLRVALISMPWWFIGCLAQLYIFFMPMYKIIRQKERNILVIFYVYIMTACLWTQSMIYFDYMYLNFIGHLPEFCLGIYLACYENKHNYFNRLKYLRFISALGLIVFLLAQYSRWIWMFNGLSFLLFSLSFYKIINVKIFEKFILYIGKISPYLYIINGFTFRRFIVQIVKYDSPLYQFLGACLWFALVVFVASVIHFIARQLALRKQT